MLADREAEQREAGARGVDKREELAVRLDRRLRAATARHRILRRAAGRGVVGAVHQGKIPAPEGRQGFSAVARPEAAKTQAAGVAPPVWAQAGTGAQRAARAPQRAHGAAGGVAGPPALSRAVREELAIS